MINKKEIVTCIILSIITCGIYGIFWFISMTDDAARVNEDPDFSGAKAFLFTLVTCGIYSIYWNYKMGKELYEAGQKRGIALADNSLVYLLLGLFGLSIVSYCLIQSDLNKLAQ